MAKRIPDLIRLSTTELKNLLAARERIDVLETEKARLLKELGGIEKELEKLLAGAAAGASRRKTGRTARKKVAGKTRKTAGRKAGKKAAKKAGKKAVKKTAGETAKRTAKKTVKKTARKAAGKTAKKTAKKTTRKTARRGGANGRVRLEDVIVAVLKKAGGSLPFKELYSAIVDGKLFPTKATNFDNVLRRTLSTSDAVKRVGRGVYAVA